MSALTRFSMKNIGLIFIAMLLVVGGGLYAVGNMKMEQFPNVDIPYMAVTVVYPGATPSQVLEDVGKPLEQQLSTVKNLKNLYVTSASNLATVFMEFDMNQSMDEAESNVQQALNNVTLPGTAQKPVVRRQGPTSDQVYTFAIGGADQDAVQKFTEDKITPLLSSVEGVSKVDVSGTTDKKILVRVDPAKLKAHNLTLDKVNQALLSNNVSAPTGDVTLNDKTMNVQVGQRLGSLDDVKNVNLILIEQNMSGMSNALQGLSSGMGQLGQAVGGLGQSVGGLTKQQALMQQEIQVMQGINQVSAQMMQDQTQLKTLQLNPSTAKNPTTAQQIQQLNGKIKAEQAKITELQGTLGRIQSMVQTSATENQQLLQHLQGSPAPARSAPTNPGTAATPSVTLTTVKLGDIADVTYGSDEQGSYTRLNGKPAVVVGIEPSVGANTVDLVKQVQAKLDGLALPKGYTISTLRDQSVEIEKSVYAMLREAAFGALLAAVVTLLFLRNLRTTIVALLSIPLSILITMLVMYWMDYSLNMMTLAGVAVAVGRVVDDSIVVIENIYRRIQMSRPEQRDQNFVVAATHEVSQAITSSTVTTIGVFAPLAFVPGIVGKFFAPFAWSVVISLAFSLLIAITAVPMMSRLFLLRLKPIEHRANALQRVYRRLLNWSLGHKLIVLALSLVLLIITGLVTSKIPVNFFPAEKSVYYTFTADLPIGASLDKSNQVATRVEQVVGNTHAAKSYNTTVTPGHVSVQITLNDNADLDAFEKTMRDQTKSIGPGIKTALGSTSGVPGGGGLIMIINGPDLPTIKKAADQLQPVITATPGVADVQSNIQGVQPQLTIAVDNDKAAINGLNPAMIAQAVRDMISGSSQTSVVLNGRTTDVNVSLNVGNLNSTDLIAAQKITNMAGNDVRIGDVATVKQESGPTSIQRLNQQEYVSISGTFTDPNSSGVQTAINNRVAKVALPAGVSYYFEGETKQISEGFTNMAIAIVVSILLVYMVMMVAFGEMLAPLAILFSLPFIFVGVIWGLLLSGEALGMPALVGVLMLIGIVVTNAIVLIDRVMQNRAQGMSVNDALLEAGSTRIRPILMTAVATVGALIPLALSTEGGLISRSLAIVVISGLTTSTLLTLLIVPIAYQILDNIRRKLLGRVKRARIGGLQEN